MDKSNLSRHSDLLGDFDQKNSSQIEMNTITTNNNIVHSNRVEPTRASEPFSPKEILYQANHTEENL